MRSGATTWSQLEVVSYKVKEIAFRRDIFRDNSYFVPVVTHPGCENVYDDQDLEAREHNARNNRERLTRPGCILVSRLRSLVCKGSIRTVLTNLISSAVEVVDRCIIQIYQY